MSQSYALIHDQVQANKNYVLSLSQSMGQHAVGMVQMIRGHAVKDQIEMMNGWTEVQNAAHDWTSIVANGERSTSQFRQVTSSVISSFSNQLRDHAIGCDTLGSLEPTIDRSSSFCSKLGNRSMDTMREPWENYTFNISRMARVARTHGTNSESFFTCAADCVRSGQLLGRWLDCTIFE